MRSAKSEQDCAESSMSHKSHKKKGHSRSSAESSPLSALREPWSIQYNAPAMRVFNRWQNALARLRAAKDAVMLWSSWQAGLQLELEVAKRLVKAAQKVVFHHNTVLVLWGFATRRCKTHCTGCAKKRIELQKLQKKVSWEAAHSRSSPDKWRMNGDMIWL